ncbi:MAG: FG-GAP-like repeat-containing protein, partial [Pirellulales bacterium]|nr:FG-GAP-like repeat-containing protein [Pirellulales bacterium]
MLILLGLIGCRDRDNSHSAAQRSGPAFPASLPLPGPAPEQELSERELAASQLAFINRVRPQVEAFCGDCHVMPRPSSSSREEWEAEVEQGFMLYRTSGRTDLTVPPQEDVLNFFRYQAPQEITLPTSTHGYPPATLPRRTTTAKLPGNRPPGVTNVRWLDLGMKGAPALVYCNIGNGSVSAHWPSVAGAPTERLATLLQPVRTEACDLDGDGYTDLVVADIGEFNANDSDLGRVVWLRRVPETEKFETIVLWDNLSRVADVRPGDFDGDGDLDLLVAVFGWRSSGRIILLENQGFDADNQP